MELFDMLNVAADIWSTLLIGIWPDPMNGPQL